MKPIIELKDVEVTFRSRTGSLFKPHLVRAVQGVSMQLVPGLTLGLVGESGCGKSTTAKVMCGLQAPTAGKVFFQGDEVTKRSAHYRKLIGRVVSVVFQDPAAGICDGGPARSALGRAASTRGDCPRPVFAA